MDLTTPEAKLRIIAAAAPSVDPDEFDEDGNLIGAPYEVRLTQRCGDIAMLVMSDANPLSTLLSAFENERPFRATITGVERAIGRNGRRTGRGIVHFYSPPNQRYPEGKKERAYTEFLNRAEGKALYLDAKDAIGNSCVLLIAREKKADDSGQSVRMMRFVSPIASDPDYDENDDRFQPEWTAQQS